MNGLTVVRDFLDSLNLRTDGAYQDVANHLLKHEWYTYFETKDKTKNGEVKVHKPSLYTCTLLNYKSCSPCETVVIEMALWSRHWPNAASTSTVLLMCQVL